MEVESKVKLPYLLYTLSFCLGRATGSPAQFFILVLSVSVRHQEGVLAFQSPSLSAAATSAKGLSRATCQLLYLTLLSHGRQQQSTGQSFPFDPELCKGST